MKNLLKTFVLLIPFAFFISSCEENNDIEATNIDAGLPDMAQTLENFDEEIEYESYDVEGGENLRYWRKRKERTTFFTLTSALIQTRLLGTVAREKLTIFAPSDKAFSELGLNAWNIGKVPNLNEILLYHVVGGKVFSTDLQNGYVPTLNDAAVNVSLENGVFINDAQVIKANVRSFNGVIHVINKVLLPPTKNIVEIAASNDAFSILVKAVSRVGLVDALSGDDQLTVFAPTDDAFIALLKELGAASLDDIDDATLKAVLLYHVVPGRVYSSDLSDDLIVKTLNGASFTVDLDAPGLVDANGRESGLVTDLINIQATNGVIHVINRVILP